MNVLIDFSEEEVRTAILEYTKKRYNLVLDFNTLHLKYDGQAVTADGLVVRADNKDKDTKNNPGDFWNIDKDKL